MSDDRAGQEIDSARMGFHDALIRSHRQPGQHGELEEAARMYCQLLRSQGYTPERALVSAKKVIEEAIDDHDRPVAERAVSICIRTYYLADETPTSPNE